MKRYIRSSVVDFSSMSVENREYIAQDPSTRIDDLRILAQDVEYPVREAVAGNPSAPADILRKLSNDRYMEVICAVAHNESTPVDVLKDISSRNLPIAVINKLLTNPSIPEELLKQLVDRWQWSTYLDIDADLSNKVKLDSWEQTNAFEKDISKRIAAVCKDFGVECYNNYINVWPADNERTAEVGVVVEFISDNDRVIALEAAIEDALVDFGLYVGGWSDGHRERPKQ